MPQITSALQQHRHQTGEYTARQDAKQRSQAAQDEYTRKLAERPGLHRGNVDKHRDAATIVQLLSYLTNVRNSPTMRVDPPFCHSMRNDRGSVPAASTVNAGEGRFSSTLPQAPFPIRSVNEATLMPVRADTVAADGEGFSAAGNALRRVLVGVVTTIEQYDPLRFPGALAAPVLQRPGAASVELLNRPRRAFAPEQKLETTTAESNDVIKVPIDFSCINKKEDWSFARVLREVGTTLQKPVTGAVSDINSLMNWFRKGRCPSQEDSQRLTEVTNVVDAVVSQVLVVLPGGQSLAVAQFVVGPLLEQLGNDIEGKPVSPEERSALISQVAMMARASLKQTSRLEYERLKKGQNEKKQSDQPFELPKFKVKKGSVHVEVEVNGHKADFPLKTHRHKVVIEIPVKTGSPVREEVFFNRLYQEWQLSGTGKFNRFSKRERRVVQHYALETHHVVARDKSQSKMFSLNNPHSAQPARIDAIEMHGRLVPFRHDAKTGRSFIYDAANSRGREHEVVFAQNEWHLKKNSASARGTERFYSPEDEKNLDVSLFRVRRGKKVYVQVDPDTGIFFGDKYELTPEGNLKKMPSRGAIQTRSGDRSNPASIPKSSEGVQPAPGVIEEIPVAGTSFSGKVLKRGVADSHYIQYYTTPAASGANSEVLLLSAHGGFIDSDMVKPAVTIPSDITLRLLTPHATKLVDSGFDSFVNAGPTPEAFITLKDGKIIGVDFSPQAGNDEWVEDDSYDPQASENTMGRHDGLPNYHQYHYEGESDEMIAGVLAKNRMMADGDVTPLADVLTVSSDVSEIWDAYGMNSNVQKLMDLDQAGKLVNAQGERYKIITLGHCRNHFLQAPDSISAYQMRPVRIDEVTQDGRKKRDVDTKSHLSEVILITLYRSDVNQPFKVKEESAGYFSFTPLTRRDTTTTPSPLSPVWLG